ncbi:uncharacterized protein [Rhodnius prolixus]|uniref:Uncharacterized protein n=1 Tax=Rhodnius prolixus TaxID=13249 RepID=T1H960_RHOPR
MKNFSLIIFNCFVICGVICVTITDTPAFFESVVEKCSAEHRIDKNEARRMIGNVRRYALTEDDKCMLSCYMKERQYFVNGKINWQRIFIPVSIMLSTESERSTMWANFLNCDKYLSYGVRNDCQIAYESLRCFEDVMNA